MKIRKPDDEKFFKDIVLNDILDEISNENQDVSENTPPLRRKKHSKKNLSGKKIFFVGLIISLILLVLVLFNLVTDATNVVTHPFEKIATDTQEWKMDKDRSDYNGTLAKKVVKEKKVLPKKVELKPLKIKPIPIQKTERELAKEALRKQMLN